MELLCVTITIVFVFEDQLTLFDFLILPPRIDGHGNVRVMDEKMLRVQLKSFGVVMERRMDHEVHMETTEKNVMVLQTVMVFVGLLKSPVFVVLK